MKKFDFAQLKSHTEKRFAVPITDADGIARLLNQLSVTGDEAEVLIQQNEDGDRRLIACGAGCQDCCVVNVSITLLEGIAIARFLRTFTTDKLANVKVVLDKLWRDVRGLEDDERLILRRKCAFLDEHGCCVIYPVRPLFCRSISSTNVEACRDAVSGSVFGEIQPVMMHQFQLQLYKVLFAGVGSGLEQAGLDGRSFQLCGLVRYLLNHPTVELELLTEASLNWDELYP